MYLSAFDTSVRTAILNTAIQHYNTTLQEITTQRPQRMISHLAPFFLSYNIIQIQTITVFDTEAYYQKHCSLLQEMKNYMDIGLFCI